MDFSVATECVDLGLRAGAVVFHDIHVGPASQALRSEITAEVKAVQAKFADLNAIRSTREVAGFHDILKKVGVNPRREQNSLYRLLALALKRGELPVVNNLVDSYNLLSIRTLCSMGAHDVDTLALPVTLRLLTGGESFRPLGRDSDVAVVVGEYGYVDAQNRLLCRLDVVQADFSKVTAATVNALVIIEGTIAHAADSLRRVFQDAMELIARHCGGTGQIVALPADCLPRPRNW